VKVRFFAIAFFFSIDATAQMAEGNEGTNISASISLQTSYVDNAFRVTDDSSLPNTSEL
jgi:hypothetical protein